MGRTRVDDRGMLPVYGRGNQDLAGLSQRCCASQPHRVHVCVLVRKQSAAFILVIYGCDSFVCMRVGWQGSWLQLTWRELRGRRRAPGAKLSSDRCCAASIHAAHVECCVCVCLQRDSNV